MLTFDEKVRFIITSTLTLENKHECKFYITSFIILIGVQVSFSEINT